MSLGALVFLNPMLLAGLAALPVIYWLLRAVPPPPKRVEFPPTRILVGIEDSEKQPVHTPWWLVLLRLLAAAALVLALAEPVVDRNRETRLEGSGPLVLVTDNGWASATHWDARRVTMDRLIAEAEQLARPVLIVATAAGETIAATRLEAPAAARAASASLTPQPFAPDRTLALGRALPLLEGKRGMAIVWLTDGIDHDERARAFADRLDTLAGNGGSLTVYEPDDTTTPVGLAGGLGAGGRLEASIVRVGGDAREGVVHALSARGQRLGEARYRIAEGAARTTAFFTLPLELRNQVTRLELAGERSAGAVHLLDAASQWQRVGVVSGASREQAQPLLSPTHYIEKALAPFAELALAPGSNVAAAFDDLVSRNASVVMLADIGTITGELAERVGKWIERGGVLVRFAGPRLEKGGDGLLPTPLRTGGRTLGGSLSWSEPRALAQFGEESPFAGLAIPKDVRVQRQVLADPSRLAARATVWARLEDGTPLVTATVKGDGRIVLFHVTANSDWSNLPLSGVFVEMLRRLTSLGRAGGVGELDKAGQVAAVASAATPAEAVLAPRRTLNGLGVLGPPPPTAEAVVAADFAKLRASARHPPGYYGNDEAPRALNIVDRATTLRPLPSLPSAAALRSYAKQAATSLKPLLLSLATVLVLIDILAVLFLQGALTGSWRRRATKTASLGAMAALGVLTGLAAGAIDVNAQSPGFRRTLPEARSPPTRRVPGASPADVAIMRATSKVTFGWVKTGDAHVDETSRRGLAGLSSVLKRRTSVDPGEAMAIDIAADEITFHPVLYWPVLADARPLPARVLAKIDAYMKQGGMIVFDTRDHVQGVPQGFTTSGSGETPLQRLIGGLDVPRLEPVPNGHVMTKSFYLLRAFPGRWQGGQLWVEAGQDATIDGGGKARRVDGVSSILVTSNDFAAAWAIDEGGRPVFPAVPGGEAQREMAYRVGVNLVMYALTGNYKADQVHVPALLERLGN